MIREIRHWRLTRETQGAVNLDDTHDGNRGFAYLGEDGEIIYSNAERIPEYVKEAVRKMFRVDYDCLRGYYSETGYNIWRQIDGKLTGGEPLYEAGNSCYDSQNHVPVERGETIDTLHRYCEQTGKEMAEELGIPWGGCTQEESSYEEVD